MKHILHVLLLFMYVMVMAVVSSCAGASPVHKTENGTAITVPSQDSVLAVLKDNPNADKVVTTGEDGYTVFIVPKDVIKKVMRSKPMILEASSSSEMQILINQYTTDGWILKGGVSVSTSSFGKTRYYATFVR